MRSSLSALVAFAFFSRFASTSPLAARLARPVTATIAGWESLGCFKESYLGRAILGESFVSDAMTVQLCANFCDSKNLPLLGVEFGRECYCAMDFRERNPAPIGNCWQGCGGNLSESCGSADRINAYKKISARTSITPLPGSTVTDGSDSPISASSTATSSSPTSSISLALLSSSTTPLSPTSLPSTAPLLSAIPLPSTTPLSATTSSTSSTPVSSSTTPLSPIAVPAATLLPSSYQFLDCYTDSVDARTLTGKYINSDAQTIGECATSCAGFSYFGLEYYFECFCGNELASISAPVAAAECSYPCNGNQKQTCGGFSRLSLYSFDAAPISDSVSDSGPAAVGCYMDSVASRSFPGAVFADDSMTIKLCSAHCKDAGTLLFGVEYGRECYCGNTISAKEASAFECNQPCAGNSAETCGAGDRLNVYKIAS